MAKHPTLNGRDPLYVTEQISPEAEREDFEVGRSYIFNVPPSWIFCGRVIAVNEDRVKIDRAVYVENIQEGACALNIGLFADANKAARTSHPITDGTCFRREGILVWQPCDTNTEPLWAQKAAEAIKGRR
jgi:hypothetical protein